jgi:hypothetical protein
MRGSGTAKAKGMQAMNTPMTIPPARLGDGSRGKPVLSFLTRCGVLVVALSLAGPALGEETVAVSAKVSNGYTRTKLPDGSFKVETYAFGKGDDWDSARVDASTDKLDFMTVATTVAGPLRSRNYVPTRDAKTTNLLIMVYWGTTRAPEHASNTVATTAIHDADRMQDQAQMALNHASTPSDVKNAKIQAASAAARMRDAAEQLEVEQQQRENIDAKTVALLGYDSWWLDTESASGGGERAFRKQDMLNEIEEDRYFVVLMAYDFQEMAKKKKPKLLWEAHISIREHSNQFDKRLEAMVTEASRYFGSDSKGLDHFELPEGKVEVGEIKSLGVIPARPQ